MAVRRILPQTLVAIALSASLSLPAHAADNAPVSQSKVPMPSSSDPEPDKNIGTLVGGIVTTSVGVGVGLLTLVVAAAQNCKSDRYNPGKTKSRHNCEVRDRDWTITGVVLTVAGAGVGIPLIVSGAQSLGEWRDWRRRNRPEDEKTKDDKKDARVDSTPKLQLALLEGRPAAALTVDF